MKLISYVSYMSAYANIGHLKVTFVPSENKAEITT